MPLHAKSIRPPKGAIGLVTKLRTPDSPTFRAETRIRVLAVSHAEERLRGFVVKQRDDTIPEQELQDANEAVVEYLREQNERLGDRAHVHSKRDAELINDIRAAYTGDYWDEFGACESCQAIFEIKRVRPGVRRRCPDCVGDASRHNEDESEAAAARRTSNLPRWLGERRVDYDICLGCDIFGPPLAARWARRSWEPSTRLGTMPAVSA